MRKRAIFTVALMLIGQCMSASAAGEYFSDIEQSAAKTEICRMAEKRMADSLYRGCEIQGAVRQTISSLIIKK